MSDSNNTHVKAANRTWFITGASSGIGLALATAVIERGDNVVGLARNLEPLTALADAHPDRLLIVRTDVRDQKQVDEAAKRARDEFGRIDVLVNSAGRGLFGGVEEVTDEQVRETFDVNVFGSLNVLRAVLPTLRKQRTGHVVQLSAYRGQSAGPGMGMISGVKHAVEGISDTLAQEVKPLGIQVTLVQPGPTATPFAPNFDRPPADIADYDQTVREAVKAIRSLPPEAFNSVERLVVAVLAAVDAEQPPLRLATGSIAVKTMRASLQARLVDLDAWEKVSLTVDGAFENSGSR
jgi:NAD(P)-dependent dehydrogenase (short-subunit alcohol dehydrogenase family)